jgi:hypothetical protein
MDSLQPPEELQHLWLNSSAKAENPEPIVTQILRHARRLQRRARAADVFFMVLGVVEIPILLAFVLINRDEPLVAAGNGVWAVTSGVAVAMYRAFYRSLGEEPPPNATSRQYTQYSIEYLNRRENFWVKSALPCSALESLAGVVFAFAMANGQQPEFSLVWVLLCFLLQPINWWWILRVHRKSNERRTRLREVLADLDRDPQR